MANLAKDTDKPDLRAAALRRKFYASLCTLAGLTIMGIGLAATLHSAPQASAATTLTIKPAALSAAAGIRLAKVTDRDGRTCFRASRRLPGQNRSISESFCTH